MTDTTLPDLTQIATLPATYLVYVVDPAGGILGDYGITADDLSTSLLVLRQETTGVAEAAFVQNSGNAINENSTFAGYTLQQVVKALQLQGLLA